MTSLKDVSRGCGSYFPHLHILLSIMVCSNQCSKCSDCCKVYFEVFRILPHQQNDDLERFE